MSTTCTLLVGSYVTEHAEPSPCPRGRRAKPVDAARWGTIGMIQTRTADVSKSRASQGACGVRPPPPAPTTERGSPLLRPDYSEGRRRSLRASHSSDRKLQGVRTGCEMVWQPKLNLPIHHVA